MAIYKNSREDAIKLAIQAYGVGAPGSIFQLAENIKNYIDEGTLPGGKTEVGKTEAEKAAE